MATKDPKKQVIDRLVYVDWGRPRMGDAVKVLAVDVSSGWNSRVTLKRKEVWDSAQAPSYAEQFAADILRDDPGATVAIAIHGDPVIVSRVPAYVIRRGRRVQDGLRIAYHRGVVAVVPGWEYQNPSKPKPRTYAVARAEILRALQQEGWDVRANLKMPHATHPRGGFRLWFKTQAIYESHGSQTSSFAGAHSLWIGDIRTMPVEDVLAYIERVRKSS